MAKLDVYKITGNGGGAGAVSPVAVNATRSNIKAFAGIQYSLKGIQSTLKSIERIEIEFIENLPIAVADEMQEFMKAMPVLAHNVEYNCPHCGADQIVNINGYEHFFA